MDVFTTLNFDRSAGGAVVGSSGSSFPAVPIAGEWFWRTDLQSLFRRNDSNTAWHQITCGALDGELRYFIEAPADLSQTGAYRTITGGFFFSNMTWWTSSAQTIKIMESNYTRNAQNQATSIEHKLYSPDGLTVISTVTEDITYSGAFEVSRLRTIVAGSSDNKLLYFIGAPAEGWASGAYRTITGGAFPSNMTWWTSSAQTARIMESNYTRNAQKQATTIEHKLYATDGTTVISTITESVVYSGVLELNRTRTIT